MKQRKVAIIGGGASGLVAAIMSRRNGDDVTIYEMNDRVGKKILQTGNGRCNFCNLNLSSKFYNTKFVDSVFDKFGLKEIINFFEELGLVWHADGEGRMYPLSNSASTILDILRFECERLGVDFKLGQKIASINKNQKGFNILSNFYDKVILSTGNVDENMLNKFGHFQTEKREGLTSVKVNKEDVSGLGGVRVKCRVSVSLGEENHSESGELQFKTDGLSGICIFNISSLISRKNAKFPEIFIDFMENLTNNQLKLKIEEQVKRCKNLTVDKIFVGMFHKNLAQLLIKKVGLKTSDDTSLLDECKIDRFVSIIKNYPVKIIGVNEGGQVKVGGYKTVEFDDNLQSKFVDNLYVVGECLDVDGLCGGYNLAWAWASGAIAGNN